MHAETLPLIAGILIAVVGVAVLVDASTPDDVLLKGERRRRARVPRHRAGEGSIGIGIMCMAAAFLGRDAWSYSVVVVIVGTVCLIYGVVTNWTYLAANISNRGPLRRRSPND